MLDEIIAIGGVVLALFTIPAFIAGLHAVTAALAILSLSWSATALAIAAHETYR